MNGQFTGGSANFWLIMILPPAAAVLTLILLAYALYEKENERTGLKAELDNANAFVAMEGEQGALVALKQGAVRVQKLFDRQVALERQYNRVDGPATEERQELSSADLAIKRAKQRFWKARRAVLKEFPDLDVPETIAECAEMVVTGDEAETSDEETEPVQS